MSEISHSPENQNGRFLSEDNLTDVQGKVDRLVLEDDNRKDIGESLLSVHSRELDGIRETLVIRWNKDKPDGTPDPTHAFVRFGINTDEGGAEDLYHVGIDPQLCWHEFIHGGETIRMPLGEREARELIARLHSFLPKKDM